MAQNDIYMVQDFQNYGQSVDRLENVYFFSQVNILGDAARCATAFRETLLPSILNIQTSTIHHNRLVVTNLFNVADFATYTFEPNQGNGTAGGVGAETMPPHDAVTFRLVRTTRQIRNGFKRYAGLPETATANGRITDNAYLPLIEALRQQLAANITAEAGGVVFDPIVVKRIREGVAPNYTYRLPNSSAEAIISRFTDVLVSLEVRTQNTRKR